MSHSFGLSSVIIPDDEVNLDGGVDSEVGDLTDDGGGAVDVEDTLVDSHFETIPGVGTVTTRGTSGSDSEALGGHAVGTLGLEAGVLGAGNDLRASLFEGLDESGGKSHSDLANFLEGLLTLGLIFFVHNIVCLLIISFRHSSI